MSRPMMIIAALVVTVGVVALIWSQNETANPAASETESVDERVKEEQNSRAIVNERPNDPQARFRLAHALRLLGRTDEAEVELVGAIKLGLPEAQAQREVVLLMATRDWSPKMTGLFQRVVRENPDDMEVLLAVADSYTAKTWWTRAEPLYTQLIALKPDQTELYFKRGVARMRGAYFRSATEDFRKVLAAEPERYEAKLFLGHSLLGDARMPEAEPLLTECHAQRPEAIEPLVGLSACAIERNDLETAENLLTQAATRQENSPLVLHELASLYLRQQRTALAITTLRRLILLDPKHRQGHLLMAQALLASGNTAEARRHEQIYKDLDREEEQRLSTRRGMQ